LICTNSALTSPSRVRALLAELDVHPSKALGQSFLIDRNILDILIGAADLSSGDQVLEVGPGLGVVTERLLDCAGRVVAVEKDRRMFSYLEKSLGGREGLELVCGDALDVDLEGLLESGVNKVVSNLPYSSGTRMILNLVQARRPPALVVVTVQLEVAGRLAAAAGDKNRGIPGTWAELAYGVEVIKTVSRTCFWPRPEVVSAVVRLRRNDRPLPEHGTRETFYRLTKHAFSHRRKQLVSILKNAPKGLRMSPEESCGILEKAGAGVRARPGDLDIDHWLEFARQCRR